MQGLSRRRKAELALQVGEFIRQYQRKSQKGVEPNDRRYDRGIEQILRRLKPVDLNDLLNGEGV